MLVEDENGLNEIAAVFLLLKENECSTSSMINAFKKHNRKWESVRVVMTDKDTTEREVFAASLPKAQLLICLFQTFWSFRKEISVEKMGITSGQCTMLQQMAYSTSEGNYSAIYLCFCSCAPAVMLYYINANWHPIHYQWVMGMKYSTGKFLRGMNNWLENINQNLKSVISRYEDFIEQFYLVLRVLRSERDHKATLVIQKVPVAYQSTTDEAYLNYMKL